MRIFLTISLCLISLDLFSAAINPLVGCLGKEELQLHKAKRTGPVYRLNQIFLNDLVSAGDITLKKKYYDRVCIRPVFTPSVDLMREILIDGNKIFILSNNIENENLRNFQLSAIDEIQRVIPHIFFSYVSDLQSKMPTADCLSKYIPDLKYFQGRFKYLENELGSNNLMSDKKRINNIFNSLRKLSEIKRNCQKDADKKKKNN